MKSKVQMMLYTILLSFLLLQLCTGLLLNKFHLKKSSIRLQMDSSSSGNTPTSASEDGSNMIVPDDESPADKYKREKLAEIAERKAQEVFVTRSKLSFEAFTYSLFTHIFHYFIAYFVRIFHFDLFIFIFRYRKI